MEDARLFFRTRARVENMTMTMGPVHEWRTQVQTTSTSTSTAYSERLHSTKGACPAGHPRPHYGRLKS